MMKENKSHLFEAKSLFAPLGKDENEILENFDLIIQNIKSLSSKQLYKLPQEINDLSHLLTDDRSSRKKGYMNRNENLIPYTYYFMWWNLYRLSHLFAGFPSNAFDNLTDGDYCLDLGSGPLTVVIALYLSRPELRGKKLTWYCLDTSSNALSLGEELFLSICARLSNTSFEPWQIIKIKGDMNTNINHKAKFVTCANMFNELYYDTSMSLEEATKKYTANTLDFCVKNENSDFPSILIIEPAFPRSSRFISLTRDALIRKGFYPVAPCPHTQKCPMDGHRGGKWCHFVLETNLPSNNLSAKTVSSGVLTNNSLSANSLSAPKKLLKLSEKSDLPKDRASVSFIFAKKMPNLQENSHSSTTSLLQLRIASDKIFIPHEKGGNRFAFYACSEIGLVLAENLPKSTKSGDLIEKTVETKNPNSKNFPIDKKSGAKIISF